MPYDIARLDGSRGDFVFLMLCNGAQGNVVDGEWILGPQRAFLVSGYRSTIGTLWPIEENAGRFFLKNFLANRWHGDGMPKQEALSQRSIELDCKANSAHPRHGFLDPLRNSVRVEQFLSFNFLSDQQSDKKIERQETKIITRVV